MSTLIVPKQFEVLIRGELFFGNIGNQEEISTLQALMKIVYKSFSMAVVNPNHCPEIPD